MMARMKSTEADRAYAAGLIDGRAHMRVRRRGGVEFRLFHEYEHVTKWLCQRFGGKRYAIKGGYEWRLYSKAEIASVLNYVIPHLIAKRTGAEALRDYCLPDTAPPDREALFKALSRRKG